PRISAAHVTGQGKVNWPITLRLGQDYIRPEGIRTRPWCQVLEFDPQARRWTDEVCAFDAQAEIPVVQSDRTHHIHLSKFTVSQDYDCTTRRQQLVQMRQHRVTFFELAAALMRQHLPQQWNGPFAIIYAYHQHVQVFVHLSAVNLDTQAGMSQRTQDTKRYRVIQCPCIHLWVFQPASKALRYIVFLYIQGYPLGYPAQSYIPCFKYPDHQQRQRLHQFRSSPFLPVLQSVVQFV